MLLTVLPTDEPDTGELDEPEAEAEVLLALLDPKTAETPEVASDASDVLPLSADPETLPLAPLVPLAPV